ncbi:putative bifunctional diguanylate cyclase/phosphodiesterase [Demequina gelatinilytica]|uniref:putative bifunctional diguanylate cyclase/phosphodiesterase n=1 Tax=Demequina gelatinilytica TaxID=1638980 RepID=UPI000A50EC8B|nr:EAL domain-containing protein [Demequina gelatinilytica]
MSTRQPRPRLLALYIAAITVLGFAGTIATALTREVPPELNGTRITSIVFLAVFAIVGEIRPIVIVRNGEETRKLSLATPAVLAVLAVSGPVIAVTVQVLSTVIDDVRTRRPLYKILFNAAQYAVCVLIASAVYQGLAGDLAGERSAGAHAIRMGALMLAGLIMIVLNWVIVGLAIALATGQEVRAPLRTDAGEFIATHAVLMALGCIAADIAPHGIGVLALLVPPAIAARRFASAGARHAHEAAHDPLTGLRNRTRLNQTLEEALADGPRHAGQGPGLILLDLDLFKVFNDTLGHPVGDQILCVVAQRLASAVPEDAPVHRLGGDEFAVVIAGTVEDARALSARMLASLEEPVRIDDLELLVRASAGIAVAPMHGEDVSGLMKNADIALYHAKLERDRISVYSPEYDANTVERLRLLADLRAAIDARSLDVVYQPQLDIAGRRLVAVEALARWNHPVRGPIGPDVFIPLAEDSGLIFRLTTVVLDTALAQLAQWRIKGHDVRMSVNLSARHLSDLAAPQQIALALQRHGVPASSLVLEVTETAILSDPARANLVIRGLRALGVTIAIDDYGTGNASLSYLRRLEVDELKIDRLFVSNIRAEGHDMIIVRSTIALALELGLRVVAEGVEDELTIEALRGFGDVVAQGYHVGRPGPADVVEEMLIRANGLPAQARA